MMQHPNIPADRAKGTVLIMAGGTGGHIFPALSIARNLHSRGFRTEWLGTSRGLEAEVLRETDIPLHFIKVQGLRGRKMSSVLLAPFTIAAASVQSLKILRKVKPCCVLGMGGYVTGPGGVAARLAGRKLLIHEQNAIAGFSNRLLARIAHSVMEAFPGTFDPRFRAIPTGNPVRVEITDLPAPQARIEHSCAPLRVLILGGSLGAVAINKLLPRALALLPQADRPQIWHQSGRNNLEATRQEYSAAGLTLGEGCQVDSFIKDMAAAYGWADLVICRAGATTVSEIAAAGVPSLLIPYPHAVDDHQTRNAHWLSDAGAARLLQQSALTPELLAEQFNTFIHDRKTLAAMAGCARALARTDASDLVAEQCIAACRDRKI